MTKRWIIHRAKAQRYRKKVWRQRHKVPTNFRNKKYIKSLKRGKPQLPLKKIKIWKTTYLQNPKTGIMKGRKRVKGGAGDMTSIAVDPKTFRIFGRFPRPKKRTRASLNFGFTTIGSISPSLDKAEENLRKKKLEREILARPNPKEDLPAVFKREENIRRLDRTIEQEERALQQAREYLNVKK